MESELNHILPRVTRELGGIRSLKRLPSNTNEVYKITTKTGTQRIIKIFKNKGLATDRDVEIITHFGDLGVLKKVHFFGEHENQRFAVLEYIPGRILSRIVYNKNPGEYYSQIDEFLKKCSKINLKGFGRLDNNFEGTYTSWLNFILDLENSIYKRTQNFEKVSGLSKDQLKKRTIAVLKNQKFNPVLIPADVNLSNFIIDREQKVRVIDIGSWISGDADFPRGLMLAHAWKTPLHEALFAGKNKNEKLLLYSLLESLSVLSFSQANNPEKIRQIKPFGNKKTILKILEEQREALFDDRPH